MSFFRRELSPVERFESALREKQAALEDQGAVFTMILPGN